MATRISARRFVASAIDAPQTIRIAGEENFPANVVEGIKKFQMVLPQSGDNASRLE